ncbi:YhcH/YjgK/YiaL family protein [Arcobacter lacus]|uniref:YhcH/YjgK/YiaL family protein n=1 Tax=Arcobacter lacus TaxID=1912876 RepID=UPI0021BAAC85|nr:YhcH/YjgK/YiaL family protein [Arcobacter lacus]MCT7910049.1 YhcH/YjgK/YiaL family protein [Arcobacter lacus]
MAIFGKFENVKNQITDSKFEKAFSYIEKLQDKNSKEYQSLKNIELDNCNKIVLDGNCFVLEQAYVSKDKKDCFFESHKKYIDIQYIFYGTELMEVGNINNLEIIQEYNESLDYAKHAQFVNSSSLLIRENELAIFYPSDAHMPCIKVDKNEKIIKAVFKVAI